MGNDVSTMLKLDKSEDSLDKFRGALVGLAVGDALGNAIEKLSPGKLDAVTDLLDLQNLSLTPGKWTDNTSLALCLAASLVQKQRFDMKDQMDKYAAWYQHGYMASELFRTSIGDTTKRALEEYINGGPVLAGKDMPNSAGKGCAMRLAAVPMFYWGQDRAQAAERSGQSARLTHGAPACIDACRYLGAVLHDLLKGAPKTAVLAEDYIDVNASAWGPTPLCEEVAAVARGSFKLRQPPQVVASGYVVQALEAALWAFHNSTSFKEGAVKVINLGHGPDTVGAIYGQLAGAYYGLAGIPSRWVAKLYWADRLQELASHLHSIAHKQPFSRLPSISRPTPGPTKEVPLAG